MRRYETVVILDFESTDGDIQDFTDRYSQLIKQGGGEVVKIDSWGVKKLAYLVKKKEKGRYMLLDYLGEPDLITELERQLKLSEDILKFLSVKIEDDVDLEAFRAKVEEEKAAAEKAKAEAEAKAKAEAEAKAQAEAEAKAKAEAEAQAEAEKEAQPEAVPEAEAESSEAKPEETASPTEPAEQPVPADDPAQAPSEPDASSPAEATDASETTKEGE